MSKKYFVLIFIQSFLSCEEENDFALRQERWYLHEFHATTTSSCTFGDDDHEQAANMIFNTLIGWDEEAFQTTSICLDERQRFVLMKNDIENIEGSSSVFGDSMMWEHKGQQLRFKIQKHTIDTLVLTTKGYVPGLRNLRFLFLKHK